MTITKRDLTEALYSKSDLTKKEAMDVIEKLLEIIKRTLERGEGMLITGFGKFEVKEKNPRRGRNPVTGNELTLGSRRIVTFRCSDVLRGKLNKKK
jgi:integration host factor subunit alpha